MVLVLLDQVFLGFFPMLSSCCHFAGQGEVACTQTRLIAMQLQMLATLGGQGEFHGVKQWLGESLHVCQLARRGGGAVWDRCKQFAATVVAFVDVVAAVNVPIKDTWCLLVLFWAFV